jgi:hypothetical protein
MGGCRMSCFCLHAPSLAHVTAPAGTRSTSDHRMRTSRMGPFPQHTYTSSVQCAAPHMATVTCEHFQVAAPPLCRSDSDNCMIALSCVLPQFGTAPGQCSRGGLQNVVSTLDGLRWVGMGAKVLTSLTWIQTLIQSVTVTYLV